ncbi:hypothetical protein H4219_006400, partial [Mycoemilia scoparia]
STLGNSFSSTDLTGWRRTSFQASIQFGCIKCYAVEDYSFHFNYNKDTDETPIKCFNNAMNYGNFVHIYGRPGYIKVTGDVAMALLTIAKKSNPSITTYTSCTCNQQQQQQSTQMTGEYGDSGSGYSGTSNSYSYGYGYQQ